MTDKLGLRNFRVLLFLFLINLTACYHSENTKKGNDSLSKDLSIFIPPDTSTIPKDQFGDMVRYGRELIVNTAHYIGPAGTVGKYLGNKMNCGNCHLDAGTRPFGSNFLSTHARYPQYRGRENMVLTI